jgi:cysteine desulfurase/selenocysteine lyase
VREDFPILATRVHGHPLVYLDNAATTQKPRAVLDAERRFYEEANANVHRGVHRLSEQATERFESARETVRRFVNAARPEEIIFVHGTTEAINLVAQSYGRRHVGPGDEVLITGLEHHSNIVPWQMLCEETGARLVVVPIDDRGELHLDEFDRLLGPRTKIAALSFMSNAIGTVNPVRDLIERAHARGVPVLLDAAQAAPHLGIDVRALGCDFLALSGHKMYGPMGIGALYGRYDRLEAMPPWQGGGDMIRSVTFAKTEYNVVPFKFEAGTPNVGGAVGLAAAIEYLESLGLDAVRVHEDALLARGIDALAPIPGLRFIGTASTRSAILSFTLDGVHPHDAGTVLDDEGIAVRTGHHCAQPIMERFGVPATIRASLGLYNTAAEIDALAAAVRRVTAMFR